MEKVKKRPITPTVSIARKQPATHTAKPTQKSLFSLRMKEIDRDFARQTKQLTSLTKKFGKKLNEPITFGSKPRKK